MTSADPPQAAGPDSGNADTPYAANPESGNADTPYAANPESGNAETPYAANPESGNAETPAAANPDYGNAETPYAANPGYGNPETPYAANPESGNAETPYAANPESGNAETPSAANPGYGNAETPSAANPDSRSLTPAAANPEVGNVQTPSAANPESRSLTPAAVNPPGGTPGPAAGMAEAEPPAAANPLYRIDPAQARRLGRSPEQLISSRLPAGSPSAAKALRQLPNPAALIEEARRFHEVDDEYIRPEMPIKEIVFRTLLARGNQPMGLQELAAELNDRWATPLRPLALSPQRLQAALDGDAYYGFAPAPP